MSRAMEPNERQAHVLAEQGVHVFPCVPGEKIPATKEGFKEATTDHARIEKFWSRNPDRNVAVRTGAPHGPDVLDIDNHGPDANGYPAWNRLQHEGLAGTPQAIIKTPSGGLHAWYKGTEQGSGRIPSEHVDIRSTGGYALVPPSTVGGRPYYVVQHQPSADTFDWAKCKELLAPQRTVQPSQHPAVAGAEEVERAARWIEKNAAEPHNRNQPLFNMAARLAEKNLLDKDGIERLVRTADVTGLRGGRAEAERTIGSAVRNVTRDSSPKAPQREMGE